MKTIFSRLVFFLGTVALSWTLVASLPAETLPSSVQEKIENFFQQLQKGETQPAFEKMIQGSLIGRNTAQIQNLVNQFNNAVSLYGSVTGSEYVNTNMVGDSLCKTVYLSKNENHPLRWTFIFYKSTADWTLINIEFDDNIEVLF